MKMLKILKISSLIKLWKSLKRRYDRYSKKMKMPTILKNFLMFIFGGLVMLISIVAIISIGVLLLKYNIVDSKEIFGLLGHGKSSYVKEQTILEEESLITDIVEEAQDSVVSIAVEHVEFNPMSGPQKYDDNIGTGFIVDGEGLIVTNQHVVSNRNAEYSVTTRDQVTYSVTNIYRDEVNDLAIIKIDTEGNELDAVELGDSDALTVGQLVVAIGTPLGDYPGTVTTGIVSGLNRTVSAGGSSFLGNIKEYESVIQTDAAVNPGNSGGPLLNSDAQVIGINFATTVGADNISFALPVNVLKERLVDFEAHGGKFIKPYLGVNSQMIGQFDSMRFGVPIGAFVDDVIEGSPADRSGIEQGDIITVVSGKDVSSGLHNVILSFEPGEVVTVTVWRKTGDTYREGEYKEFTVTLGEQDQ